MKGPLSGVRVLDLTTVIMGPYATQHLGDLGAEVIKIESPQGDSIRAVGPNGDKGLGPLFMNLNRNKKSVVLDLKQELGHKALLALVESADVLVYNIRPQAMERLGLGFEKLEKINSRLIYVGAYGYSQQGRYAANPAFDDLIQAACGISHAMGVAQCSTPAYVPVTIVDRGVGVYLFGTICAALFERSRTNRGQKIDVPMFETMTHMVLGDHSFGQTFVPSVGDFGYPRLLAQARKPYRTLDGYLACTIYTDAQWQRFFMALGCAERMQADARFCSIGARTVHVEAVYGFLEKTLLERTSSEWLDLLERADIPCFPVHTFESLRADPHLQDIDFFAQQEHPVVGNVITMKHPAEWSATPYFVYKKSLRIVS